MSLILTSMSGARSWINAIPGGEPESEDASIDETLGRLGSGSGRLVCFYGAPWEAALAVGAGDAAWIDEWTRYHAAVVDAWQESPDRIVLVNPGRIADPNEVCRRLSDLGIPVDKQRLSGSGGSELPDWARLLLAARFADCAPEAWECYEALESCAQVTGDTPELRGTLEPGDTGDLGWLLGLVGSALDRRAYLERENELLLQQIGQLQSELGKSASRQQAANQLAKRAATLGKRARLMVSSRHGDPVHGCEQVQK